MAAAVITSTNSGAVSSRRGKLRFGLCCQFLEEPIKFRTSTATSALKLSAEDRARKIAMLCRSNAQALMEAIQFCHANGIGAFRINSQILPLKTHPVAGYELRELPGGEGIMEMFRRCGRFAKEKSIRLSFHPDQFVVLNSPNRKTLEHSIAELEYQTEVAEWVGADTVNIHAGGAYGDKISALNALASNIEKLPDRVRFRLTLENDDRTYGPADLISLCKSTCTPFVYDVHHHRCLPDGLSVEEATGLALETWNREPLFHISSPIEGWNGPKPGRHHDFIDPDDFPAEWMNLDLTVEVEAKAKEIAVLRLKTEIESRFGQFNEK